MFIGALAGEHREYEKDFVRRSVEFVSCLVNGRGARMTSNCAQFACRTGVALRAAP